MDRTAALRIYCETLGFKQGDTVTHATLNKKRKLRLLSTHPDKVLTIEDREVKKSYLQVEVKEAAFKLAHNRIEGACNALDREINILRGPFVVPAPSTTAVPSNSRAPPAPPAS